jgi:hypothetical protein
MAGPSRWYSVSLVITVSNMPISFKMHAKPTRAANIVWLSVVLLVVADSASWNWTEI